MPQMNKGGKFIFGKSIIKEGGRIQLPTQAIDEYDITADKKVYQYQFTKEGYRWGYSRVLQDKSKSVSS